MAFTLHTYSDGELTSEPLTPQIPYELESSFLDLGDFLFLFLFSHLSSVLSNHREGKREEKEETIY